MAHKVHPKSYRLRRVEDWNSRWMNLKKLPEFLEEDFKIREFLNKKLKDSAVSRIEIERFPGKINIIIFSIRPGLIIGRGGEGSEKLKEMLSKIVTPKQEIKIEIREIKNPWTTAFLVSKWMGQRLEKRIPYRRTIKQALDKITANKEIKGARIEVAGRLDGTEIARREWLQKGSLPRQTIRADIDYAYQKAHCPFGVIGVKVWIYKGERFI